MQTPYQLEQAINQSTKHQIIILFMDLGVIHREKRCKACKTPMRLSVCKNNRDGYSWRCMLKSCSGHQRYWSIRENTFFSNFTTSLGEILIILIRYSSRQPLYSIKQNLDTPSRTIDRIISKLKLMIPAPNYTNDKLGGPGYIVQVDETMMNFKCKSHRGRSPSNRTDALCIVETRNGITRSFATVIADKRASTIIPIICANVASRSIIHTDEHASYRSLNNIGFEHSSVCHKYEFVNRVNGTHTQGIESFHNELKLEIKRRKGVITEKRDVFLNEFCFYFNNRTNLFEAVMNLIRIN